MEPRYGCSLFPLPHWKVLPQVGDKKCPTRQLWISGNQVTHRWTVCCSEASPPLRFIYDHLQGTSDQSTYIKKRRKPITGVSLHPAHTAIAPSLMLRNIPTQQLDEYVCYSSPFKSYKLKIIIIIIIKKFCLFPSHRLASLENMVKTRGNPSSFSSEDALPKDLSALFHAYLSIAGAPVFQQQQFPFSIYPGATSTLPHPPAARARGWEGAWLPAASGSPFGGRWRS